MSFKENLKYELSRHDCTVKEFANKINVKYDTVISYLDARETQPSAENAVKIAKGLDVTVEYLMTGEKDELTEYLKNKGLFDNLKILPPELSTDLREFVSVLLKYIKIPC